MFAAVGCGSSGTENPSNGTGGTTVVTGGITVATGGTTVVAGGTTAKTIEDVVPKANDIPGWIINSSIPSTSGQLAAFGKTKEKAEALIDGSAAAFFKPPYSSVLAWQNYTNSNGYAVDLHVWQMTSSTLAAALYAELAKDYPLYSNNTWTVVAGLGDEARITNTGTTWWINFQKDAYIVEISLDKPPLGSEETDTVGRDVAKAYANELVKRF
jgi:hypothetical protein